MPSFADPAAPSPECWALHDGAAGNRRQVLALAGALGVHCREIVLEPSAWARAFAPRRFPGMVASLGTDFAAALRGPSPRLAIGCGRIAALATRLARERGASVVQILDPRLPLRHWDQLVIPAHDRRSGDNVLALQGSLHPVDEAWLARARTTNDRPATMPAPRTAVLLGAPTRAVPWSRPDLEAALARIEASCTHEGGSLWLCASRRTPAAWADGLRARLSGAPHRAWLDPRDGENPYGAVLAWADRIVVTADSANMLSEACATTAPVYLIGSDRARGRIAHYLRVLQAERRALPLAQWGDRGDPRPWRETACIAAELRRRLGLD